MTARFYRVVVTREYADLKECTDAYFSLTEEGRIADIKMFRDPLALVFVEKDIWSPSHADAVAYSKARYGHECDIVAVLEREPAV